MRGFLTTAAVAAGLAFSPVMATSADAAVVVFDVSDIFSVDPFGDPLNEVYNLSIGANSEVIGIGWDVTLFADTPSWLSEMVVAFGSTSAQSLVQLTPAVGDDFPGTESYSSGGIINLVDLGLNFSVDADGQLRLEFYETFDDFANDWDGIWISGALTIEYVPSGVVPEPASWALMIAGFGLVGAAVRRRRMAPTG